MCIVNAISIDQTMSWYQIRSTWVEATESVEEAIHVKLKKPLPNRLWHNLSAYDDTATV